MKVALSGVTETLLIPLWARAMETQMANPIVRDQEALRILKQLDYDFSKFAGAWMSQVGVAVRTMLLDRCVHNAINKNPDAVVVNIGAGLDTRFLRMDNGTIDWYDIDLPKSIDIRRRFFNDSDRYHMISRSVFDYGWAECIKQDNRHVILIAEGILMYFTRDQVKDLMAMLTGAFPKAEMFFEMMTPTLVKKSSKHDTLRKIDAVFKWGITCGKEMETLVPGIQFIYEWNYFDFHRDRWRWMAWAAKIPAFRNRFNNRIVYLRFCE